MKKALQMCLNWRVLVGLGGVAVVLWLVAPKEVLGVLPFLAFLACPISMVLMMRTMQGERTGSRPDRFAKSRPIDSRVDHLAELRGRLAAMQAEQESIGQEIELLERDGDSADGRVRP